MERLQIAIEKARQSRSQVQAQSRTGEPAAEAEAADPVATDPVAPSDAWAGLAPIVLKPKVLQHNRIVTLEAGREAGPFDMLRTRIVQQANREGWRRIAVISAHNAAGKTTLTANLAFCFGRQSDLRTLVLDFDLRRPSLAGVLGQTPKQSMTDVITGRVAFADHALRHGGNLAFGLGKSGGRNASEVLQSRDTTRLLAELDETYRPDFVLFDMPPVLAADEALGFLTNVDAALIVAEAERTPIRQIETVEEQVAEITKVLGVVLNRCSFGGKDNGDYGYY